MNFYERFRNTETNLKLNPSRAETPRGNVLFENHLGHFQRGVSLELIY